MNNTHFDLIIGSFNPAEIRASSYNPQVAYLLNNDFNGGYSSIITLNLAQTTKDGKSYEVINFRPLNFNVNTLEGLSFCPLGSQFVVLNLEDSQARLINRIGDQDGVALTPLSVDALTCI